MIEFDKVKFLGRVLNHLTDDELKEFAGSSLDEHLTKACWIPTPSPRFVDDKTYRIGPYSFVGKRGNEAFIGEALHSMGVEEMWGHTKIETVTRDSLGVPHSLKLPEDEADPNFEWIEAVLRYVDFVVWNTMLKHTINCFDVQAIPKEIEASASQLMTEVVYSVLQFEDLQCESYDTVQQTISSIIGESK